MITMMMMIMAMVNGTDCTDNGRKMCAAEDVKVGNDFLLSVVFHGGSSTAVATSPGEVQWKEKDKFSY